MSKIFNQCSEVTTTHLWKRDHNSQKKVFGLEGELPLPPNCVGEGSLQDGTKLRILFDTGATRSFMSKNFYMKNRQLHLLPKYTSPCKAIMVGSGQCISVLFVIPIIVTIGMHTFEIFTTVCDIHDGMDLVFGMQNMIETEGEVSARDGCYRFRNRSIAIYPTMKHTVKPNEEFLVRVNAPFCESLCGTGMAKFFCGDKVDTILLRLVNTHGVVKYYNSSSQAVVLDPSVPVGILDLRSLGYFKVCYKDLVARLSTKFTMFHYLKAPPNPETEDVFSRTTIRTTGPSGRKDPYPWLESDDPRRHMSDLQILYDHIDLSNSLLTSREKSKLMALVVKHKKAFSLRDEIGHCPNLKADLKVIDDSSFFVRPFPISETDKPFMDRQMERLISLGILSCNSTSHTSPVMLITRKLTKDKRPVVDFRLLNTRILRRNTSIPLMTDVLNILGNSKCECLTCCDLKDAYHSIPLTERSKEFCGILPYFGSPIYRYEVLPMGIACAPQIWMDYITLILNDLDQKSKFIAIMDDLLIHSSKQEHWGLVESLLKAMIKNGLKLSPKKCQFFKTNLTYMGNQFVIRNKTMTITPLRAEAELKQSSKFLPPVPRKSARASVASSIMYRYSVRICNASCAPLSS